MSENYAELLIQPKPLQQNEKVMCCCRFDTIVSGLFSVLTLKCFGLFGKIVGWIGILIVSWSIYFYWIYFRHNDNLSSVDTPIYSLLHGIWEVSVFILSSGVMAYFIFVFNSDTWCCDIGKRFDWSNGGSINSFCYTYDPFNKTNRNNFIIFTIIGLIIYIQHDYIYWGSDISNFKKQPYRLLLHFCEILLVWFPMSMAELHIIILLSKYTHYLEFNFNDIKCNTNFFDIRLEYKQLHELFKSETKMVAYYTLWLIINGTLHTWSSVAQMMNYSFNFRHLFFCITGFMFFNLFPGYTLLVTHQLSKVYNKFVDKLEDLLDAWELNNDIEMNTTSHEWSYDKLLEYIKKHKFVLKLMDVQLDLKSILLPMVIICLQQFLKYSIQNFN